MSRNVHNQSKLPDSRPSVKWRLVKKLRGIRRDSLRVRTGEEGDIGLNTRREVPFLQAAIYYSVCYIKIILIYDNKSRLY